MTAGRQEDSDGRNQVVTPMHGRCSPPRTEADGPVLVAACPMAPKEHNPRLTGAIRRTTKEAPAIQL